MPTIDPRIAWPGWETVRLIGRGSFGGVYEIRRDVFGETEKAALKVITIPENDREIEELRDEGYDDESITSTFQTHLKSIVAEYSLMRKLNGHTNVVNCDDVRYVQHENGIGWDIFIKMELLTPMKKAIDKSVTEEQTLRIGKDLCRALILCGKHNIIHRDIKPDNIFVSDSGDCKLGDFGIAKTMEKTSGGTKIGTYDYMAPEVYQGKPYGRTADIYSLGMVLYWLLNERRTPYLPLPPKLPSVAEKEEARLRRFGGEALPAPAHGSPALQQIVLKACAYDPRDRYQSAEELLQALEAVGAIHESPVDPGERRFAPVGVGVLDDPKTSTNTNGLSRTPAPTAETAVPAQDGTIGAFGAASVGAAISRPPVKERSPEEDGTVGVFGAAGAKNAPMPVGAIHESPAEKPASDEDGTVSVFGTSGAKNAPMPVGAIHESPAEKPSPDEDGTVSAFGAAKAEKPATVGADALGGPQKPEQSPEEATVSAVQRSKPQPTRQEKTPEAPKPEPEPQSKSGKKKKPLIILGAVAAVAVLAVALFLFLGKAGESPVFRVMRLRIVNPDGKVQEEVYTYNSDNTGKCVYYYDGEVMGYADLVLNDKGLIVQEDHYYDGVFQYRREYSYDNRGNQTHYWSYDSELSLKYESEYEYDEYHVYTWYADYDVENGSRVMSAEFKLSDREHGTQNDYENGSITRTSTCVRTYDGNKLVKQEWYDEGGNPTASQSYVWDEYYNSTEVRRTRSDGSVSVFYYEYERVG